MNESINTRKYTQKLWNKVKDTFLTKDYVIKGALVGQEWTLLESTVGNTPIVLPPSDSFIELYVEMYSSNNGTITHQKTMRMDSILFESDNMEYREIVLDSMYDAQTYVRYDFVTNSIIPTVYEGNEITDSSSDIITTIYTKTNKIEAGSIEAEKIVIDNTTNNLNAKNMQGALDEVVDKLNNLSDGNPQDITKEDIGLGNVDNTSDMDKPISTAQQEAIDNALSESKDYTDTKVADLVGSAPETLNTLEEVAQAINDNEDVVEALNSAIGNKASQSDLEALQDTVKNKVSQSDLSNLRNIVDTKANQLDLEELQGTVNIKADQSDLNNLSATVNTKANQSDLEALQTTVNGKVDQSELDGLQTLINNKIDQSHLETLQGIVNDKADKSEIETLQSNINSKADQSDLEALQTSVSTNESTLGDHTSNNSNPHSVTKEQVGLGEVDNTSDANKPVSVAQQEAITNSVTESKGYTDTKVSELIGNVSEDLNTLEKIAQVVEDNETAIEGLNTTVGTKANQSDLEALQTTVGTNESTLGDHTSNSSNPHSVTKEQVGLGEVDNTSDMDKPVSTATQTAINDAVTESKDYTDTKVADLVGSAPDTLDTLEEVAKAIKDNEDVVSALNSAIGTKSNQSDLEALQNAVNDKANQSDLSTLSETVDTKANQSDLEALQTTVGTNETNLNTHTSNVDNPHSVTKEQVGLGNVDNTSDANKPVSTAQQTAISNAVTESKGYTDTKVANLIGSAPETLDTLEKIAQVVEDNETAIESLNTTIGTKANQSDLTNLQDTVNSKADQSDLETLQGTVNSKADQSDLLVLQGTINDKVSQSDFANLSNVVDTKAFQSDLNNHTSNNNNPHGVTKVHVGLGEVDNTSDINKPVSTAQQEALNNVLNESKGYTDTKVADLVGTAPETLDTLEELAQAMEENEDVVSALNNAIGNKASQSDLTSHISDISNPHGVNKEQVGLGEVDNTSDINKPVSTAQQTAISNAVVESKGYTDDKIAELVENGIATDGTELSGVLVSGETTITFTSEEITNDSKLNAVYTSIFNVPLESVTFGDGTLTLVFPAQEEDMEVVALINATSKGENNIVYEGVLDELHAHTENTDNPHGVIASQIDIDNSVSGINATNIQGAIDELAVDTVLPRYKRVGLNTIGWYRIAKLSCHTLNEVLGTGGNNCDIEIGRSYNYNNNEFKKIQMVSVTQNTSFCNEISKSNEQIITKIRHTVDAVNFVGYIEVYYNATKENGVMFTLSNYRSGFGRTWKLINPELTEETVEGITVLGSHEFSLNYDVDTRINKFDYKELTGSMLDTSIPNGHYYSMGMTDSPINSEAYGYLSVMSHPTFSDKYRQLRFIRTYGDNIEYTRNMIDGVWGEWISHVKDVKDDIDRLKDTIGYSKKNLLKVALITKTQDNVEFTVNSDKSITISGTPNSNNSILIGTVTLKKGEYIISGLANGSDNTYFIYISSPYVQVENSEKTLTLTEEKTVDLLFRYNNGVAINTTIYPMIRYASIEDDTYEPYVADVQTQIDNYEEFGYWKPNSNNYGADRCYYVKTKNMLTVWFCFYPNNDISSSTYWLCSDVKKTFGVTNFNFANNLCYNGVGDFGRVAFSPESNIIGINTMNKNLLASDPIYGQISCHIH